MKQIVLLIILVVVYFTCYVRTTQHQQYVVAPIDAPKALYADWAHKHWVWLNKNVQNQERILELVNDYLVRDIPVGAVDIDSEWSTGVNNFVWNT